MPFPRHFLHDTLTLVHAWEQRLQQQQDGWLPLPWKLPPADLSCAAALSSWSCLASVAPGLPPENCCTIPADSRQSIVLPDKTSTTVVIPKLVMTTVPFIGSNMNSVSNSKVLLQKNQDKFVCPCPKSLQNSWREMNDNQMKTTLTAFSGSLPMKANSWSMRVM